MIGIVLLTLFVLLGPLALLFGVDSRVKDERDTRSWWPGAAPCGPPPLPPRDAARPTRGRRVAGPAFASPDSGLCLAELGTSCTTSTAGKTRQAW